MGLYSIHLCVPIPPILKNRRYSVKVGYVNNPFCFSKVSGGFNKVFLRSLIACRIIVS